MPRRTAPTGRITLRLGQDLELDLGYWRRGDGDETRRVVARGSITHPLPKPNRDVPVIAWTIRTPDSDDCCHGLNFRDLCLQALVARGWTYSHDGLPT